MLMSGADETAGVRKSMSERDARGPEDEEHERARRPSSRREFARHGKHLPGMARGRACRRAMPET